MCNTASAHHVASTNAPAWIPHVPPSSRGSSTHAVTLHITGPLPRRLLLLREHARENPPSPSSLPDDYKSELREQLPLIAGSAAAGVVFIVSLVAISIVCSRWVPVGLLRPWKVEVVGCSWGRFGVGREGQGTPVAGESSELPPLSECCWQGSSLGPLPAAHPSSPALFSFLFSLLAGSVPTARRRCTAINYSTTAPGEVSGQGRCS